MPYIVQKRSDIQNGFLQNIELIPNTSQRNFPYKPAGQTGYRVDPLDTLPTLSSDAFTSDVAGLVAWMLANVSDSDTTGTAATGTITTVAVASLVNGDYFTISDGSNSYRFVFNVDGDYGVASPYVEVDVSGDVTADDVRDTVITVINSVANYNVLAASGGASTVNLTNTDYNLTTAAVRNAATMTENVANAGFAVSGWAGAVGSAALTAAEAYTNAWDILDLVAYGDTATAASDIDYASINTALTKGAIVQEQLQAILDILSGRTYTVASGTTIEAAGVFVYSHDDDFWSDDVRRIRLTGALRISLKEGRLALMSSDDFTYGGTDGAAVVVYNDDGTLLDDDLPE